MVLSGEEKSGGSGGMGGGGGTIGKEARKLAASK